MAGGKLLMAMRPNVRDELLRRSGWTWYLWAVALVLGTCALAYMTFRRGLTAVLDDPTNFLLLAICVMAGMAGLRTRPRRPKPPPDSRPLHLE